MQHEAIPHALLGMDVLCQAKSGMGKTAVFVLTTLNQLVIKEGVVSVLVLCHTRELAYQVRVPLPRRVSCALHRCRPAYAQIGHEYNRFSKFLPGVKCAVFFGGVPKATHVKLLQEDKPQVRTRRCVGFVLACQSPYSGDADCCGYPWPRVGSHRVWRPQGGRHQAFHP